MWGKHNLWGGALEIHGEDPEDDEEEQNHDRRLDSAAYQPPSDEVKQSWLLRPNKRDKRKKKKAYLNSVMVVSLTGVSVFLLLIVIIVKFSPRHLHHPVSTSDNYTQALHRAIMFFNAQRSERLPKNNVSWRGDSCLQDGHLVGSYYDGGDATKYKFLAAFAMTMLSWSVLDYSDKYQAVGLLDHVKDIIQWGIDYLLKTFNSSGNSTDTIVSLIGEAELGSTGGRTKHKCWMCPEEIQFLRTASECGTCPALATETAAASIIWTAECLAGTTSFLVLYCFSAD